MIWNLYTNNFWETSNFWLYDCLLLSLDFYNGLNAEDSIMIIVNAKFVTICKNHIYCLDTITLNNHIIKASVSKCPIPKFSKAPTIFTYNAGWHFLIGDSRIWIMIRVLRLSLAGANISVEGWACQEPITEISEIITQPFIIHYHEKCNKPIFNVITKVFNWNSKLANFKFWHYLTNERILINF